MRVFHCDQYVVPLPPGGLPLVLTLGGGYAKPLSATLEAHVGTYETALSVFR